MRGGRRVPIDLVAFGQSLAYWRFIYHWNPEELAQRIRTVQRTLRSSDRRMTAAWIRLMERGADGALHSLRTDRLHAVAAALNVPLTALASPRPPDVEATPVGWTVGTVMAWHHRRTISEEADSAGSNPCHCPDRSSP